MMMVSHKMPFLKTNIYLVYIKKPHRTKAFREKLHIFIYIKVIYLKRTVYLMHQQVYHSQTVHSVYTIFLRFVFISGKQRLLDI